MVRKTQGPECPTSEVPMFLPHDPVLSGDAAGRVRRDPRTGVH